MERTNLKKKSLWTRIDFSKVCTLIYLCCSRWRWILTVCFLMKLGHYAALQLQSCRRKGRQCNPPFLQKCPAWSHSLFQAERTSLASSQGQEGKLRPRGQDQDSPTSAYGSLSQPPRRACWGEDGSLGSCWAVAVIDQLINWAFNGAGKERKWLFKKPGAASASIVPKGPEDMAGQWDACARPAA